VDPLHRLGSSFTEAGKTSFSSNVDPGLECNMEKWDQMNHQFRVRTETLADAEEIQCIIQGEKIEKQEKDKYIPRTDASD